MKGVLKMPEEITGVNQSVAAEQTGSEVTTQGTTETQQTQINTGVEQKPAAGGTEGVEKAFAARLAKERERIEAEYKNRFDSELKSHPTLSYLEQKAQRFGITVEQLIKNDQEHDQKQRLDELVQKNIPPEYAQKLLKVDELQQWKEQTEKQRQKETQQQQRQEDTRKMYIEFLQMYPDVKPEQIPKEVWQLVQQGHRLASAYAIHENKLLKEKLSGVETQHQTQTANTKNAETSTGSVKSNGKTGTFFTREQVAAMGRDELTQNYNAIKESEKHWK
jgi:hypothetical protein